MRLRASLPGGVPPAAPCQPQARAPAMATVGSRASFTVRRLLDLPEAEGGGGPAEQDSPERYGVSRSRAWMETERSHYLCEWGGEPRPGTGGVPGTGGGESLKQPPF